MSRLDALGLSENTILVFMTDNGSAEGFENWRGEPGSFEGFNAGMRAGKGSEYDGGHRVPFFVRWPGGGIVGGRDVDALTAHIDVLPTLAELCGAPVPDTLALDGQTLAPLLKDGTATLDERTLFVHSQRIDIPVKWRHSAVMTERWRLVNGKELYDIEADPDQSADVAPDQPDVVKRLRASYPHYDSVAVFDVELPAGPTELQTWLTSADGTERTPISSISNACAELSRRHRNR